MGNRASIVLKNDSGADTKAVYLQWNGGKGSVAAFIEEAKRRMNCVNGVLDTKGSSLTCQTFYTILYGVAREFFAYGGSYKQRSPLSVYLFSSKELRTMKEDNGCYLVHDDFTCKRINVDKLRGYEKECYEHITNFFNRSHDAMSVVIDSYSREYADAQSLTIDKLQEEIGRNKAIIDLAKSHQKRLMEDLEQLEKKTLEA